MLMRMLIFCYCSQNNRSSVQAAPGVCLEKGVELIWAHTRAAGSRISPSQDREFFFVCLRVSCMQPQDLLAAGCDTESR